MQQHRLPCLLFLGISWFAFTCSTPVLAAGGADDATRAAARAAGYEGVRAYQNGDYALAVDKLDRAFGVVKVPTLGLWYARALVKTGKLVEAAERYGEVIRLEVTEGKVKEQQKAQTEAADELEALQPKIPALTIAVVGATEDTQILFDGNQVPKKLIGLATPANPGTHRIQAKQGAKVVEQTVTLGESDRKTVELRLKSSGSRATSAAVHAPTTGSKASTTDVNTNTQDTPNNRSGSTQKAVGWVSLGLGGAATVAGVVAALLANSKRDELDRSNKCQGTNCLPDVDDTRTSYNRLRNISTVSFIVGAVGVGAGTTLLLTTPKPQEASVSAWMGIGSVGLTGSF